MTTPNGERPDNRTDRLRDARSRAAEQVAKAEQHLAQIDAALAEEERRHRAPARERAKRLGWAIITGGGLAALIAALGRQLRDHASATKLAATTAAASVGGSVLTMALAPVVVPSIDDALPGRRGRPPRTTITVPGPAQTHPALPPRPGVGSPSPTASPSGFPAPSAVPGTGEPTVSPEATPPGPTSSAEPTPEPTPRPPASPEPEPSPSPTPTPPGLGEPPPQTPPQTPTPTPKPPADGRGLCVLGLRLPVGVDLRVLC